MIKVLIAIQLSIGALNSYSESMLCSTPRFVSLHLPEAILGDGIVQTNKRIQASKEMRRELSNWMSQVKARMIEVDSFDEVSDKKIAINEVKQQVVEVATLIDLHKKGLENATRLDNRDPSREGAGRAGDERTPLIHVLNRLNDISGNHNPRDIIAQLEYALSWVSQEL